MNKKIIFLIIAITLLSIICFEGFVDFLFAHPSALGRLPGYLHSQITWFYRHEHHVIQYEPDCSQYDPELFYTLKPGSCFFSGREFNNQYFINSLGLRDDEESLKAPEVIVLGDSVAMGWGIEQNETMAQQIEAMAGLKVLNAGISSYGTVREMKLLNRLDLSRVKYLVI